LDVALEFVDRINRRDVDLLCELMTEDHRFVDSGGWRAPRRESLGDTCGMESGRTG
jgi:hypothetical protein